jgi:cation diffusion facilitator family transporter
MEVAAPMTTGPPRDEPADRGPLRTALVSVFAAALLVAIKLVAGLLTGSLGLIAEALHSGTDLVAALLTFFALRVSLRPPDRDHPYGHGKAEHLAALGEASFLLLVSVFIGFQSVRRLTGDAHPEIDAAWWAIALLLVVIVIDASRTVVSYRAAKRHNSAALASNALHFASDLLGTIAVLGGLIAVRAGVEQADSIAALAVAALVVVAAVRLMRQNVEVLMDRISDAGDAAARAAIAGAEPGVELRRLRVRHARLRARRGPRDRGLDRGGRAARAAAQRRRRPRGARRGRGRPAGARERRGADRPGRARGPQRPRPARRRPLRALAAPQAARRPRPRRRARDHDQRGACDPRGRPGAPRRPHAHRAAVLGRRERRAAAGRGRGRGPGDPSRRA